MKIKTTLGSFALLTASFMFGCSTETSAPLESSDIDANIAVAPAADDTEWKVESVRDGLPDSDATGPSLRTLAVAQAEKCLTVTYGVRGRNANGNMLYELSQSVGFCYDGNKVTYYNAYEPQVRTHILWKNLSKSVKTSEGPNRAFVQATANAEFALCGGNANVCIDHHYPSVSITLRKDGTYAASVNPG